MLNSEIILTTIINASPFMILSIPFIIISYILIHIVYKCKPKVVDSIFVLCIYFSIIFILSITILPDMNLEIFDINNIFDEYHFNLIPLNTIKPYYLMAMGGDLSAIINLFGNIVIFIPIGFFISGKLSRKRKISILLVCFILSSVIEFSQSAFSRYGDIDDIFLNTIGGYLGYLLFNYIDVLFCIYSKIIHSKKSYIQNAIFIVLQLIIWVIYLVMIFLMYNFISDYLTTHFYAV
ncbi:VanZ family protein [Ruminococcus sp.]|uniref:VanZ family protein n=1 Tax=Ruminococcus sp. TaxID=41978 RepID=UPI004028CC7E